MSYHPFNQKPQGYSSPPVFTPWSQEVGGLFPPTPSLPFKPSIFSPFAAFHPFLIHQQNNFYNSNFNLAQPPALQPLPSPPFSNPQRIRQLQDSKRPPAPSQVIVISDDEDDQPVEVKPKVALIRLKNEAHTARPMHLQDRMLQNLKQ
jgi:hypothetical protein